MAIFLAGLVLFLGVHSISIINDPWRNRMVDKIGEIPWKGIYSLVAIAGLIMLVWGYGLARYDTTQLYSPPTWLQHISLLLLLPVFPLLIAAYLPGRIKAAAKHPMLLAVKLWALSHLLANGSVISVILFGSILAWAVVDRISLKHRNQRPTPGIPSTQFNDILAVVAGIGMYIAFVLWLHNLLFGVSPY